MSAPASSLRSRVEASPTLPSGAPRSTTSPGAGSVAEPTDEFTAHSDRRSPPAGQRRLPAPAYDRGVSLGVTAGREDAASDNEAAVAAPPRDLVPASVRRRLEPVRSRDWWSWAAALWVVAIAAILRFVTLSFPPTLVFDEVYYATEGQQLLDHGVEWRTETDSAGNILG